MRISLRLMIQQTVHVVGCANGVGGRQLGCESAVQVLKNSEIMKSCCVDLKWKAVVNEINTGRHLSAIPGITQMMQQLAYHSAETLKNDGEVLVLGGDHSCAIGTWSGVATAKRDEGDLGLIWVDAHMDAHTPATSDTGNVHGMPVAHLLGFGEKSLTTIGDCSPKILPENFCMVGIRSFEGPEQALLDHLGVRVFYMDEVDKRGISEVMQEATYHVSRKTVGYGMSIDIDGFDVPYAPAVGTPEEGGINADKFLEALMRIDLRNLLATEVVEFLPRFDDQWKTSERLVVNLIETIYQTKFFQQNTTDALKKRKSFIL